MLCFDNYNYYSFEVGICDGPLVVAMVTLQEVFFPNMIFQIMIYRTLFHRMRVHRYLDVTAYTLNMSLNMFEIGFLLGTETTSTLLKPGSISSFKNNFLF